MALKKESPATNGAIQHRLPNSGIKSSRTRPASKLERVLLLLIERKNAGLFALEAIQLCGDTCLNSTVSTLANKYHLEIEREPHYHQREDGEAVRFTRYAIKRKEQRIKALQALRVLSKRRSRKGGGHE